MSSAFSRMAATICSSNLTSRFAAILTHGIVIIVITLRHKIVGVVPFVKRRSCSYIRANNCTYPPDCIFAWVRHSTSWKSTTNDPKRQHQMNTTVKS